MVDEVGGLGSRPRASPLPIIGRGVDGALVEKRGLQDVGQTRQGLVGIRCTGQGRAAQRLEGFAFVVALLAPLLVDSALSLRLARLGIDEDPAWRDAPIARWHDVRARARRERRHGLGVRLAQNLLGFRQGGGDPGDPLAAGLGELLQICGALERTVGYEIGGVGRGVELRHVIPDDLAERCAIMPIATQGLHQHWDTGLVLYHQLQHHLVEVRAMLPTLALGDGHNLFVRRRSAVIPAIDMKTRRSEMGEPAHQPQPRGRRGGNEAVECRHPKVVEGIEGAPEGVLIEMAGLHAGGNEARDGLILEKMGHEVELLVEKTSTVEHHGFDRMAGG